MDEITVFAVLRPEVTELSDTERAAIRTRLLAGSGPAAAAARPVAAPCPAAQSPAAQSPGRRPARARRLALAGVGAVAAAVTAAVVILPGSGPARPVASGRPPSSRPATPGRSGPAPSRPAPVAAPATASAVFLLAARAAAATPDLKPGPGQFIYVEQLIVGEDYYRITKQSSRLIRVPPYRERDWLSADGRRGLLRTQRYLSGSRWVTTYHQAVQCQPGQVARHACLPGYLTGLPTTVRGMHRYLLGTQGPNGTVAYRILSGISGTSWETGMLVPNRSYALMFRTAAKVPGIRLVHGVVDVAGRPGIAVAACVPAVINKGSMPRFHGCPERDELIFDARTYELIGEYQVAAKGHPPLPGSPSSALLRIAVVSRLGQLP